MLKASFAIAAVALMSCSASASPQEPFEIPASLDWQVSPADKDQASAGQVQFQIGYHTANHSSMNGNDVALATLDGLSAAQLTSAGQPVSFVLHHDAGDLRCKGVAGEGRGTGTCVYAANPGFAAALKQRGVAAPREDQQFVLAMHDIGLDYVDELRREGYATPGPDDLVLAGTHGAGMRQLKAMDGAGYRFGDVANLVRVRDHGVSAKYILAMKDYGYTGLKAEELVRLRDHGVSASYVGEMRQMGYAKMQPEALVNLRDHGVSAHWVGEMRQLGYEALPAETLVKLRDHGISPSFVGRANRDGQKRSPDELIRLRDGGDREERRDRDHDRDAGQD